ncbi:unnamed protein product [Spirodela intermedia]|uniref:ENT domain-containing protein n=1 Tax=Spirodela intermedia TaxID=51605 RepID=A0A7I8KZB0_SPIIN|nr:unnamed protein product [Spirodela intermedia]
MKYKKGTKVEVLDKREVPCGSWRRAEIVSGNGHTYRVKYDPSPPGTGELVERVPRKVIRPRPLSAQDPVDLVAGDIVEVLDSASWKLSEVLSTVDPNYFYVRLLGSLRTLKVQRSDLRLRQCWADNRWVAIGKDVRNSDDEELMKQGFCLMVNCQKGEGSTKEQNFEKSCGIEVPSRGKKRGFRYCSSIPKSLHRDRKRLKAVDKVGSHRQLVVNQCHSQQKVDAAVFPQKMPGDRYMPTFLTSRTGISVMDMDEVKSSEDVGFCFTRCLEPTDASTCSSSGSNDLDLLYRYLSTGSGLDRDDLSDDANSSCWSKLGATKSISTKGDAAERIHKLELYAYRTTMEALYSSGSITWEQEELMTNLRLELHISNDEHLSELRYLSSSKSDLPCQTDPMPQSL